MEERKINFKKNDDNTPVLDPDGMLYEKLTEKQKKINERISLLLYMLKEGSLKEGTKEALLELFHKNAIDILNELGYEDSLNKSTMNTSRKYAHSTMRTGN